MYGEKRKSTSAGIAPSFLAIAFALLLLIPSGARASADVVFSTTAAFDAGTKSASGGNFQVETTTDNGKIAADTLALGNAFGDTFTSTDADGTTFKWSGKVITGCTYSVTAGVYRLTESTTTGSNDCEMSNQFTAGGSMDVRMKFDLTAGAVLVDFCLMSTRECSSDTAQGYGGTANGVYYERTATSIIPKKVVNGVTSNLGGATTIAGEPLWMRISRSTNDWTFYYSSDGAIWTTDETDTLAGVPASLYSGANTLHLNTAAVTVLDVDSYLQTAGTIQSGAYQSAGNWKSAAQTATSSSFDTLTLQYSGASGSTFVTAVSLISGSGTYIFTDNTDLTTDTSHVYTLGAITVPGAWKLQVNFTGAGASSVVVSSADIAFVASAACTINTFTGISGLSSILAIMLGIGILLAIVGAVMVWKKEANGGIDVKSITVVVIGIVVIISVAATLISQFAC